MNKYIHFHNNVSTRKAACEWGFGSDNMKKYMAYGLFGLQVRIQGGGPGPPWP